MFGLVFLAVSLGALVFALLGLVDAARRPDAAFRSAGKLSRGAWMAILAASAVAALLQAQLLLLVGLVAVIVYHVDVKVAVAEHEGPLR